MTINTPPSIEFNRIYSNHKIRQPDPTGTHYKFYEIHIQTNSGKIKTPIKGKWCPILSAATLQLQNNKTRRRKELSLRASMRPTTEDNSDRQMSSSVPQTVQTNKLNKLFNI
jgi:hypothetical protein